MSNCYSSQAEYEDHDFTGGVFCNDCGEPDKPAELKGRIERLSHTVRKLSGHAAWDISELIDEGYLKEGDLD